MPAAEQRQQQQRAVCLIQDCERDAVTRGVCRSCYTTLYLRVEKGETTWAALEKAGLVLPSGQFRLAPRSPAAAALDALQANDKAAS